MVDTRETFTEREELEMLLPWFVAGTLDADDRQRVERYIAAHPDMRFQLDLIRDEQGETVVANEALSGAPAGALDKLRTAIAAEPRRITVAAVRQSLMAELGRLFSSPTPRAVQWAGAAAAVLMVVQAAVIGGMLMRTSGGADGGAPQIAERSVTAPRTAESRAPAARDRATRSYGVASGAVSQGTRVLVRFVPDLPVEKVSQFLREQRAVIVAGPKPGGFFEIRIATEELSQADREAAIGKLKAATDTISQVLQ